MASVTESIPTAGLLYNLFSNRRHTLDDVVIEAGRALSRVLPSFSAEIYVMHSPGMLRAVLPFGQYDSRSRPSSPRNHDVNSMADHGGETITTTEEFLGHSYGRYGGGVDFNATYPQHLSPIGRFQGPGPGEFSSGVLSVIVGRGPVGVCAKTGQYRVVRSVPSVYDQLENGQGAVSLVVFPLIYNFRLVGVLQLTSRVSQHVDEAMLNSTLHLGSPSPTITSPNRVSMQLAQAEPMHTQLHKMCVELGIDLSTALKVSVVVTALSHSIDLYDNSAEARLQEEQLETTKERDVEELIAEKDKALGRVEHLERSRLRHFKQSRKLREVGHSFLISVSQFVVMPTLSLII